MGRVKRVIIPEDVHAVLKKEQSFLNRSGIKILTAVSNEDVLALHRGKNADLIVAYLDMAGMKGDTLCSLIRGNDELRKVSIILVCPDNAADSMQCLQCGANSFITVPIRSAVLLQEAYQLLHIAQRTSFRVPIKVKIGGTSRGKRFTGVMENISTSGMLFRSFAILHEGDSVRCSFSLTGSPKINVKAEIVRVVEREGGADTHLYGVRFVDPGDDIISAVGALQGKVPNISERA